MQIFKPILQCALCFLFLVFLPFVFFPFAIVLSTIIFLAMCFLFLPKFVNFYLGRHKTKRQDKKIAKIVKNSKEQEAGNKKHVVEIIIIDIII